MPKDAVLMPSELTAENGAKYLMMGEFFTETEMPNPEFSGDDDNEPETFIHREAIPWTTIKEIYAKAVEHLGK